MINAKSTPGGNLRAELVVAEIEARAARLRNGLAQLDRRIARAAAARRDEVDKLRSYVDAVLAKVATVEGQVEHACRHPVVSGTIVMRAGDLLAAAPRAHRRDPS